MTPTARCGFTFIEVTVAVALLLVVVLVTLEAQQWSLRRMESDSRKMSAGRAAHFVNEELRKRAVRCRWAWVVPPDKLEGTAGEPAVRAVRASIASPAVTGTSTCADSPLMYVARSVSTETTTDAVDVTEYYFSADDRRLFIAGLPLDKPLDLVKFRKSRPHLLGYVIRADMHQDNLRLPAERERCTVVGAVHLQAESEEDEYGLFVWEDAHACCVRGRAIHYGFSDRRL